MLEKTSLVLAGICEVLVGLLMAAMTGVVIIGVFCRYVLGDALSWSEELARYLMIWMSFLAASLLVREEGHIGITLLRDRLPGRWMKPLLLAGDLGVISFLAMWGAISWEAYELVKDDLSPGLDIRLGWVFASQPVCALLMLVQAVVVLFRHLRNGATGPAEPETRP